MFDIGSSELLLIAVVALLVIGPKDLPRVLNSVGKWVAKARAMTGHFKAGLETMAREAELEDMEKQWAAHNDRILKDHPPTGDLFASPPDTDDTAPVDGDLSEEDGPASAETPAAPSPAAP